MWRIKTPTRQIGKFPINPPPGIPRDAFTNGNPQFGLPSTQLEADWFDMVQEEIANVIELVGVPLLPPDPQALSYRQLYDAIRLIAEGVRFPEAPATGRYYGRRVVPPDPGAWLPVCEEAPIGTGQSYARYEGMWNPINIAPPDLSGYLPLTGGTMLTGAGGAEGTITWNLPAVPPDGFDCLIFLRDPNAVNIAIGLYLDPVTPNTVELYTQVRYPGDKFTWYSGGPTPIAQIFGNGDAHFIGGVTCAALATTYIGCSGQADIAGPLNVTVSGLNVAGNIGGSGPANVLTGNLTVNQQVHSSTLIVNGTAVIGSVATITTLSVLGDAIVNGTITTGACNAGSVGTGYIHATTGLFDLGVTMNGGLRVAGTHTTDPSYGLVVFQPAYFGSSMFVIADAAFSANASFGGGLNITGSWQGDGWSIHTAGGINAGSTIQTAAGLIVTGAAQVGALNSTGNISGTGGSNTLSGGLDVGIGVTVGPFGVQTTGNLQVIRGDTAAAKLHLRVPAGVPATNMAINAQGAEMRFGYSDADGVILDNRMTIHSGGVAFAQVPSWPGFPLGAWEELLARIDALEARLGTA
jgi:cytoskeletal protein CcmA (bactofilin family)